MKKIVANSLATIFIFSSFTISEFTAVDAAAAQPDPDCDNYAHILDQRIETKDGYCPEDTRTERKPFNERRPELINQQPKQKYDVEFVDECTIGLESFRGCDQNPDAARCEDGTAPYTRIIRFIGGPRDGQTMITNGVCPENNTPIDIQDGEVIERLIITPSEFRSFPILGSVLQSEPQKFSLRNGHTHLWAAGETQTFNTDIQGIATTLRAIPIGWNWKYGDGTTRNLDFPGEPAPNHTLRDETPTSHSYKETGTYSVGLTTLFRGEFSVDGGPWQSIPGQAAVPSDPIEIDVWRTKKELIARD
ncbi:hypothetical protein ACFO7V_16040 [Glutamicibacter bergerei]|uniref:PKD domain-containing protein n=1 Tax=Glutamicibacter bergerei TaxID=256702 RepID=A0ABV9MS71_9MICC|nr:hypothetical protein [Micrococcaceae bacterium]